MEGTIEAEPGGSGRGNLAPGISRPRDPGIDGIGPEQAGLVCVVTRGPEGQDRGAWFGSKNRQTAKFGKKAKIIKGGIDEKMVFLFLISWA